jgi:hypothetical protein
MAAMRRQHGTGRLYLKWGAFYGRWRTLDGRYVNRRLGKVCERGSQEGISRREAERMLRRLMETETQPRVAIDVRARTVDEVADELRGRLAIEGARLSYRQNCESMQRVHVSPAIGKRRVESVQRPDIERLARAMLARGLAPKTVRNVMTFLHMVFALALAVRNGWATAKWSPTRRDRPSSARPAAGGAEHRQRGGASGLLSLVREPASQGLAPGPLLGGRLDVRARRVRMRRQPPQRLRDGRQLRRRARHPVQVDVVARGARAFGGSGAQRGQQRQSLLVFVRRDRRNAGDAVDGQMHRSRHAARRHPSAAGSARGRIRTPAGKYCGL